MSQLSETTIGCKPRRKLKPTVVKKRKKAGKKEGNHFTKSYSRTRVNIFAPSG